MDDRILGVAAGISNTSDTEGCMEGISNVIRSVWAELQRDISQMLTRKCVDAEVNEFLVKSVIYPC